MYCSRCGHWIPDNANFCETCGCSYTSYINSGSQPINRLQSLINEANNGNALANEELGIIYSSGDGVVKNPILAFQYFYKAAMAGMPDSQSMLAICYRFGNGTAINYNESFRWALAAANQGDLMGTTLVADCYYDGLGTYVDHFTAFNYYLQAANEGDEYAQFCVGRAYAYGDGVQADLATGYKWLVQAANAGDTDAKNLLNEYYNNGYDEYYLFGPSSWQDIYDRYTQQLIGTKIYWGRNIPQQLIDTAWINYGQSASKLQNSNIYLLEDDSVFADPGKFGLMILNNSIVNSRGWCVNSGQFAANGNAIFIRFYDNEPWQEFFRFDNLNDNSTRILVNILNDYIVLINS